MWQGSLPCRRVGWSLRISGVWCPGEDGEAVAASSRRNKVLPGLAPFRRRLPRRRRGSSGDFCSFGAAAFGVMAWSDCIDALLAKGGDGGYRRLAEAADGSGALQMGGPALTPDPGLDELGEHAGNGCCTRPMVLMRLNPTCWSWLLLRLTNALWQGATPAPGFDLAGVFFVLRWQLWRRRTTSTHGRRGSCRGSKGLLCKNFLCEGLLCKLAAMVPLAVSFSYGVLSVFVIVCVLFSYSYKYR